MNLSEKNLFEIKKMLEYIFVSEETHISFNKLNYRLKLSESEIRTIIFYLYSLNLIYTKNRIGIFVNEGYIKKLGLKKLKCSLRENDITFQSKQFSLEFKELNELLDYGVFRELRDFDEDVNFLLSILLQIYYHFQYSPLYKHEVKIEFDQINFNNVGYISCNKKIITSMQYFVDNIKWYC